MMRKMAVITGSRADYGILFSIIRLLHEDPDVQLLLLVTGMHLSEAFGMTVREIEQQGIPIAGRIAILSDDDSDEAAALAMGRAVTGFARAYARLKPDIIVVLGDRFEVHAAVSAAVPFRIPVGHIHGGELTEGAVDELFRHSITKMSHLHFAATREYADRIIQMGEQPARVYVSGAPGLDAIKTLDLQDREKLAAELNIPSEGPLGIVTFHPATVEKGQAETQIKEVLKALDSFPDVYWIFTASNADMEGRTILDCIKTHVSSRDNADLFLSLGQTMYLSVLREASLMAGNSSSGIIEAPSFGLPVVNIGLRQQGRIRARNVIDVHECDSAKIKSAVKTALSKAFRDSLKDMQNPYGDGRSGARIVGILKEADLSAIIRKPFYTKSV